MKSEYDTSVLLAPFRGDAHFVAGTILAIEFPPTRMGDYHLASSSSPMVDVGTMNGATALDIDADTRPAGAGADIGADEFLVGNTQIGPRLRGTTLTVTARVLATRQPAAKLTVVGGLAAQQVSSSCTQCTGLLQIRRGAHVRSYVMRHTASGFSVSVRKLRPGTYRVRAVITDHRAHRISRSAWKTITIKHGKGAR